MMTLIRWVVENAHCPKQRDAAPRTTQCDLVVVTRRYGACKLRACAGGAWAAILTLTSWLGDRGVLL